MNCILDFQQTTESASGRKYDRNKMYEHLFVYAVLYILTFTPSYTEKMQIKCTIAVHLKHILQHTL
jgi:hypothetical protein